MVGARFASTTTRMTIAQKVSALALFANAALLPFYSSTRSQIISSSSRRSPCTCVSAAASSSAPLSELRWDNLPQIVRLDLPAAAVRGR